MRSLIAAAEDSTRPEAGLIGGGIILAVLIAAGCLIGWLDFLEFLVYFAIGAAVFVAVVLALDGGTDDCIGRPDDVTAFCYPSGP